jgi:repressor LexA
MSSRALLHETYEAIRDHTASHGYPPSYRELGKILGLSSTDSVRDRVLALEKAGMVERVEGSPRALRLIPIEDAT